MAKVALNGGQRAICVSYEGARGDADSQKCKAANTLHEGESGGGYGARTRGLDNAIVALSQLS